MKCAMTPIEFLLAIFMYIKVKRLRYLSGTEISVISSLFLCVRHFSLKLYTANLMFYEPFKSLNNVKIFFCTMLLEIRNNIAFEVSQASPACPTDTSSI